ncbi:MAG: hypothetical protein EPN91_03750 [Salinibacterium sp.]|nr:MAG: hypothetical protein EPN91_03750 [Salinibacterium sp.]
MDQPPYTTYPPGADFAGLARRVSLAGPEPYLFTGEDALQIDSFASVAGLTLTISGVMLGEGLQLLPFSFTHTPASNRTLVTTRTSVGSGWLQHLRVVVSTGTPLVGQVFVFARACRGVTSVALPLGTIISGYLTANSDLFWPGVAPTSPLEGAGAIRSITGTTPGPGLEISEVVPTGARWDLLSFRAQLVTSAVVTGRIAQFILDDGANLYGEYAATDPITASQTGSWTFSTAGFTPRAQGGFNINIGSPVGVRLAAGHRIRTLTINIQAADQYSAVQYLVREWLEN